MGRLERCSTLIRSGRMKSAVFLEGPDMVEVPMSLVAGFKTDQTGSFFGMISIITDAHPGFEAP